MSALARYFLARRPQGGRLRPHAWSAPDRGARGRGSRHPLRRTTRAADSRAVPRAGGRPMVVYTPAVPEDHGELTAGSRDHGFTVEKRSQMLGHLVGRQIRDGRGGHARQDHHLDARGMAQPRGLTGRRQRLSGRHLEELRRQSGAGQRAAAGGRGRRVRPLVPPPTARRGGRHGRRRRPPRHLRDARGGEGGLRAVRASSIRPGGALVHQARRQTSWCDNDRRSRCTAIPTTRRATSTPATCSCIEGGHYRYDLVSAGRVWSKAARWAFRAGSTSKTRSRPSPRCGAPPGPKEVDAGCRRACGGALASFSGVKRRFEFYVNTPQAGLHGRLCPPSARTGRDAHLGAADVSRPARDGGVPAAPLHPHARPLPQSSPRRCRRPTKWCCCRSIPAREEPIAGIASEIIARTGHRAVPHRRPRSAGRRQSRRMPTTDVVVSFGAGNIDACCDARGGRIA